MKERKRTSKRRLLSGLLAALMLAGCLPGQVQTQALASYESGAGQTETADARAGSINTDIGQQTFQVGTYTEFTYTTTEDVDAGMVRGYFEFVGVDDPQSKVDSLQYMDQGSGTWQEFWGAFGPETGFPMTDATSRFRVKFNTAGEYQIKVSIREVSSGTDLYTVNSTVTVRDLVSVTVTADQGGTVRLDGQTVSAPVQVDRNTQLSLEVQAQAGYRIHGIFVDTQELPVTDPATFQTDISVIDNTQITVSFVKVYTITVSSQGNGDVSIDQPQVTGGSVTVDVGTTVTIHAQPDQGYRVDEVTINGILDGSLSGDNDQTYEKVLTADDDYIVEVTFAPNVYTIRTETTDNGNVLVDHAAVEHGGTARVTIQPNDGYTVDTAQVDGKAVDALSKDGTGIWFDIQAITQDTVVAVAFRETAKASEQDVTVDGSQAVRMDAGLYVLKANDAVNFSTEKDGIRLYTADGIFGGGETEKNVSVNATAQITAVELYYQADGEWYSDWHPVADFQPVSVVVDQTPATITCEPGQENHYGEYYNEDVTVSVTAEDPAEYSGIEKIEYFVTCTEIPDGTKYENVAEELKTQQGLLFQHDSADGAQAQVERKLVVDADKNNTPNVTVWVKVTDRALNVAYQSLHLKINKTPPRVYLDISGTPAADALDGYYQEPRTLTIQVEDREDTFSKAQVAEGMAIIKDGETYVVNETDIQWTQENGTYVGTYVFRDNGTYQWRLTYKNLAGLTATESVSPDAENLYQFTVDEMAPYDLTVTYEKPSLWEQILGIFGFYKDEVQVTLSAVDDVSGIQKFVYSYMVEQGASGENQGKENVAVTGQDIVQDADNPRKYTTTFEIPAQFRGTVSFSALDKAGFTSEFDDDKVLVVDNQAPEITVSYGPDSVEQGYHYGDACNATIQIKEANFFAEDVEDGLLSIQVEKTGVDGQVVTTTETPSFVSKGDDTYEAVIAFTEEGHYKLSVTYTDRSDNPAQPYEGTFTIDKTKPTIQVSYDNNTCRNGDQFSENRTATITITEHNFDCADVMVQVTANGAVAEGYAQDLAQDESWTHQGDVHTATISFTDEAHYTFDIAYTDKAGWQAGEVNYGDSVAPTKFTLDKTPPTGLNISIDGKSVLGGDSVAFDTFYSHAVVVKLEANGDISGLQSMQYQKVKAVSEFQMNGPWVDYDAQKGIAIEPTDKFILYFRAEDRAGHVSMVHSKGIVVDNQPPVGETNAPEIDILPDAPNANGYYNKDVNVDLKVLEPKYVAGSASENGYYSGLKEVSYRIYTTDTSAVQSGVLLNLQGVDQGAEYDQDGLIRAWQGSIVVDSHVFNSNGVVVEITATDNAGNTRITSTKVGEIQIDITPPTMEVRYDNNRVDSGTYFQADRTATITVTERNFNAKQVQAIITSSNGSAPSIGNWAKVPGTGNGDDTKWITTVSYRQDGDYTFQIGYTDPAGNPCAGVDYGNSAAPTAFTVDKTKPAVSVTYNNNAATNGNYYKTKRTATLVIREHNLDPNGADRDRVVISLTATDNGAPAAIPKVSAWRTQGDVHTATITYEADALYSFDITVRDKAGNYANDFPQHSFYIDQTPPSLEIVGVSDRSANRGDVIPVIRYSDTNYDPNQVSITLRGSNRGNVSLEGTFGDIQNGRTFTFRNFPKEKGVDDIYTLSATLTDKAGNTSTKTIMFSVNRFGSTYVLEEGTGKFNGTYVKEPEDVVIREINVDSLEEKKVILFKNNQTYTLVEGVDYRVEMSGGNGQWHQYLYTIFSENFEDDGVYRLTLRSLDAAGNVSENTLDTKDTEVGFGVDRTPPVVTIINLEDGATYPVERYPVRFTAWDNLLLGTITVYLDDYDQAYRVWEQKEILEILAGDGEFTFDVEGNSTKPHRVKIVCVDAAGNQCVEEITGFYVTTSPWVHFFSFTLSFYWLLLLLLILILIVIIIIVSRRRRKKVAQQ